MTPYSPSEGDWAVITGAGRGIGRFLAEHFAAKGMRIAALDIDADLAAQTAKDTGPANIGLGCDVSDRGSVIKVADELANQGVTPSLLCINAGVGSADTIADAEPDILEWVLGVNVLGPVWTAQAFLSAMRASSAPCHVMVTASSASVVPVKGPFTLYSTTKQMTAAVAEALTAELEKDGIGVTILCPGILNTEIWNARQARPERFGGPRSAPDTAGAHWRAQPGPEVLARGIDDALAKGGGWCIVPTDETTGPLMQDRHNMQHDGLHSYAISKD